MEGDWPSSYLSLREEVLNAVKKQDSLFPMILTAFGVLAAFVTNAEVDKVVCRLLCVALIFVAIVFQCKTVQYRDTVCRIAAYLVFMERKMKLPVSWENELIRFFDERRRKFERQTYLQGGKSITFSKGLLIYDLRRFRSCLSMRKKRRLGSGVGEACVKYCVAFCGSCAGHL